MTEITDEIRAGVLGALARGMSLDYAARADGIRVSEAQDIASAAGWPDRIAVQTEWRRLRGVPAGGAPVESLPTGLGPAPVAFRAPARPLAVRRPAGPRPDLSSARHPAARTVTVPQAADDRPSPHVDVQALTEEIAAPPAVALPRAELTETVTAAQPIRRRTYKPGQVPCEVCGGGVLESYVAKTRKQMHGHHPEAQQ